MKKLAYALLFGAIAGIIDVLPMIAQGLNAYANWSAFAHWLVLGILMVYIQWSFKGWLKGLILAELTAIPILIIVSEDDPLGILPIVLMSAILGSILGWATERFIK